MEKRRCEKLDHDKKPVGVQNHPDGMGWYRSLRAWGNHSPKHLLSFSLELFIYSSFLKRSIYLSGCIRSQLQLRYLCSIMWGPHCGARVQLVGLAAPQHVGFSSLTRDQTASPRCKVDS